MADKDTTKLEYTGAATAPVGYTAPSGRVYTGADTDEFRFIEADDGDVEFLEGTGAWKKTRKRGAAQPREEG